MELPAFLEEDIIYGFGYWVLTIGALVALLLGFKFAGTGLLGGDGQGIPLFTKVAMLGLTPIISYLLALKFFS